MSHNRGGAGILASVTAATSPLGKSHTSRWMRRGFEKDRLTNKELKNCDVAFFVLGADPFICI